MKIDASTINFSTSHSETSSRQVSETLRAWIGDKRPDFEGAESRANQAAATVATISQSGLLAAKNDSAYLSTGSAEAQAISQSGSDVDNDPRLMLIRMMIETLAGHKIAWISSSDIQGSATQPEVPSPPPATGEQAAQKVVQRESQKAGFGIEYDRHEKTTETEKTTFHADGIVRTSDGKEINFKIDLAMARSFTQQSDVSVREGDGVKKDPLVINFDGTAAQLQSQHFSFDLNGDGKAEDVPMLAGNSGYLAFDLSGNGKIDSGKELFGAQTGNGFAELAAYDSDGNGWIDESDAAFKKLRIWSPTADGKGSLQTLQERGVGALFLGQQSTPFALKDGANNELGAVRATGAYLMENGSAGTIQQIDLVV
jgi:hypothetical protein